MDQLRSLGRLHRASVDVRFRSGAGHGAGSELQVGGAMVIQGAVRACDPPQWQSDGCYLNSMHNRAMRSAHPSRVHLLPEKPKGSDKRKPLEVDDDAAEL